MKWSHITHLFEQNTHNNNRFRELVDIVNNTQEININGMEAFSNSLIAYLNFKEQILSGKGIDSTDIIQKYVVNKKYGEEYFRLPIIQDSHKHKFGNTIQSNGNKQLLFFWKQFIDITDNLKSLYKHDVAHIYITPKDFNENPQLFHKYINCAYQLKTFNFSLLPELKDPIINQFEIFLERIEKDVDANILSNVTYVSNPYNSEIFKTIQDLSMFDNVDSKTIHRLIFQLKLFTKDSKNTITEPFDNMTDLHNSKKIHIFSNIENIFVEIAKKMGIIWFAN